MAMRPSARVTLPPPARKVTTPTTNSTGATAEISNESTCTISVVPTLAPSMMASAGTSSTMPSAASEAVISPVAVLLCMQRREDEAGAERLEAVAQRLGEEAAQIRTERAQHAGEDHVQAPQQQRHAAHQVKQNNRSHRPPAPHVQFEHRHPPPTGHRRM